MLSDFECTFTICFKIQEYDLKSLKFTLDVGRGGRAWTSQGVYVMLNVGCVTV